MPSRMHRVHVCLAVTCHLHFWRNDWNLLHATAVTRGGTGTGIRISTKSWPWWRKCPTSPAGTQTRGLSFMIQTPKGSNEHLFNTDTQYANNLPSTEQAAKAQPKQVFFFHFLSFLTMYLLSLCGLIKGISLKICLLFVCVTTNKHWF